MQDDEAKPGVTYRPAAAEPANTDSAITSSEPATAPQPTSIGAMTAPQAVSAPETAAPPIYSPSTETAPQSLQNESQSMQDADLGDEPHNESEAPEQVNPTAETALMSWNAPEFTFTNKPAGWYFLLALFFTAMIGLAIYTRQYLTIGLLVLMCIALVIYAQRKPRTLTYSITTHGVYVGDKSYRFDHFSAFYEISDYGQRVFELVPSKQFGTLVSLPIQEGEEDKVEDLMGSVLPKVPPRNDLIDRLLRALRF